MTDFEKEQLERASELEARKEVTTYYKTLGLGSFGMSALSAEVDVAEGKIVRTRGFHFDNAYTQEELRPWTLEVNGKKLPDDYSHHDPGAWARCGDPRGSDQSYSAGRRPGL